MRDLSWMDMLPMRALPSNDKLSMLSEILHTTILVIIGILSEAESVRSFIYNMESARRTPAKGAWYLAETDGTAVRTGCG